VPQSEVIYGEKAIYSAPACGAYVPQSKVIYGEKVIYGAPACGAQCRVQGHLWGQS
jgi:hypothetical protein